MAARDPADITATGSGPRDLWVQRVLGIAVAAAKSGANPVGIVQFSKLILKWRAAEQAAVARLGELGKRVMQHPDVKGTPVAKQVQAVIPELSGLIPAFGDELRDVVDDVYNADSDEKKKSARAAARQAIATYRARLQSEARLPALEDFAKKTFGAGELHSPLFGVLDEIDHAVGV